MQKVGYKKTESKIIEINAIDRYKEDRRIQQLNKKNKKRKLTYLSAPDFNYFEEFSVYPCEVNDKTKFKAKSHNKDKQLIEYISYLYFKYEAPIFLVNTLIENLPKRENPYPASISLMNINTPFHNVSFFELFQTVSLGNSIHKLLKDFLNKKEIHYFMNSKEKLIHKAVLESKIKFINIDNKFKEYLLNSRFLNSDPLSVKNKYILQFIKNNEKELNFHILGELFDYFQNTITFNTNIKNYFSRSYQNILNDSEDWHTQQIFLKQKKNISWEQTFETWTYSNNKENRKDYIITEILTAINLSKEGREMKHCVGSYINRCVSGHSKILSFIKNGQKELTIEVNNGKINQVKGKRDRPATSSELFVVEKFAIDNNLEIAKAKYL